MLLRRNATHPTEEQAHPREDGDVAARDGDDVVGAGVRCRRCSSSSQSGASPMRMAAQPQRWRAQRRGRMAPSAPPLAPRQRASAAASRPVNVDEGGAFYRSAGRPRARERAPRPGRPDRERRRHAQQVAGSRTGDRPASARCPSATGSSATEDARPPSPPLGAVAASANAHPVDVHREPPSQPWRHREACRSTVTIGRTPLALETLRSRRKDDGRKARPRRTQRPKSDHRGDATMASNSSAKNPAPAIRAKAAPK